MKQKTYLSSFGKVGLGVLGIILLTGCATTVDIKACTTASPSGFLDGLWHGIIAPIAFVVSLFDDTVAIYDVNNNGGWYNLGFVLGSGILFGGGSRASK